jgi:hypothetical protein
MRSVNDLPVVGWALLLGAGVLGAMATVSAVRAAEPSAGVIGSRPLRDLDSRISMTPPTSLEAWEASRRELLTRIEVSLGLWPRPALDPPTPVAHGLCRMDGYSIEKIYFQSLPGMWVTGSLYRPDPMPSTAVPGMLAPHGHWQDGRFYDAGDDAARQELAIGSERFEAAARCPLQARCVGLARTGCIVLHWDMLGYADSRPISLERAHGFARLEEGIDHVNDRGWLLYTVPGEAHGHSVMGLQAINTIQALQVLKQVDGVDSNRIGITGASGGGTQSFIGAAIEPSIALAFPAVMVSTGMQGGCTCENACLLRNRVGNVHYAACIAPRPLGMTAANDWTRTMPEDGFPQLQAIYDLYGERDNVALFPAIHFDHNYNHVSGVALYSFVNDKFGLGQRNPVMERDFKRLAKNELTVWDGDHPDPGINIEMERSVLKAWHDRTASIVQHSIDGWKDDQGDAYRQMLIPALKTLLRIEPEQLGKIDWTIAQQSLGDYGKETQGTASSVAADVSCQVWMRMPDTWNRQVVIVPTTTRLNEQFVWPTLTKQWLSERTAVVVVELEGAIEADPPLQSLVQYDRLAAAYTYGYNDPLIVRRAHQLWAALAMVRGRVDPPRRVELVADASAMPAAALASTMVATGLEAMRLQGTSFRFDRVATIDDANFAPLLSRYGDIDGLLSLFAPRPLSLDAPAGPITTAAYLRHPDQLQTPSPSNAGF